MRKLDQRKIGAEWNWVFNYKGIPGDRCKLFPLLLVHLLFGHWSRPYTTSSLYIDARIIEYIPDYFYISDIDNNDRE